jgi:SHS2 domain-containing protein
MLAFTSPAGDRLLSKLTHKKAATDEAMRITRREGGWRLRLDRAKPDDTTLAHAGRNVLLLDAKVSKAMTTMMLDVEQTDSGPRLKLLRSSAALE